MRIDLHTHSAVSDGTDRPAALVEQAAAAGLDVVALTDHDTMGGWDEAAAAAVRSGVALVRGIELSARCQGVTVHLLCYLNDPDDPALVAELARIRADRADRARRMVARIAQDYPLTWSDVCAQTRPGTTVGRPHIADALVARGHVPDRSAAFASILRDGSGYYVPHYAPDALAAVALVRAAGGVPVLAHPGARVRGGIVSDASIARMAQAGLAGLEVAHRDNDDAQRVRLAALALEHGLFTTGSSDFHGRGKPNRLAENTTEPAVFAQIERQGRVAVVRS
ncbi:MAG: PHP domain-containing protein [Cellulomonadaceae bacterium]